MKSSISIIITLSLGLTACGQKGALYLTQKPAPVSESYNAITHHQTSIKTNQQNTHE